jgi:hypothetical protein
MKTLFCISVVFGILAAGMAMWAAKASAADPNAGGKVYELRVYKANPGKLEALHARFRDHTCKLFQKHGIELVGFWTPTQGEDAKDTLIYIVAHPNAEAQKKNFKAFLDDPEWKKAKADSEKDGVLVKKVESTMMKAADYSPIK